MPRLADNAEAYAAGRLGIFFPAHNQTPADGNLTGQCVTLNKWFLAEMTDVPSPFAARGDARYVGGNLVAQGHAVKVAYADRRRGDFAVFEYGQYGHIGVLLDADRIFEQNVNVGGVARRLVDGAYVYASRIGRLSESWRPIQATIYRIKSYTEKGVDNMPIPNADNYYNRYRKAMQHIRGRDMSRAEFDKNFVGNSDLRMLEAMLDSQEADAQLDYANWGRVAKNDKWDAQIRMAGEKIQLLENERDHTNYPKINAATQALGLPLDATADQIGAAITALKADTGNETALKMIIEEKTRQLQEVEANFVKLAKENDELKAQLAASSGDTELLNSLGKILAQLIARVGIKK